MYDFGIGRAHQPAPHFSRGIAHNDQDRKADDRGKRNPFQILQRLRMQNFLNGFVEHNQRTRKNHQHNDDPGKVFGAAITVQSGKTTNQVEINGVPDVIFFNAARPHLYVAISDPGMIQVFDTNTLQRVETVATEKGAHTLAFDAERNKVDAFLPQTHRAAVYRDDV
jgi:hypothetical protein